MSFFIVYIIRESDTMVNEETIRQIRSSVDIVDVISNYVPLTGAGKNFFGVCPFHEDHKPSMSVSREKQIYKCFSCGAGGNVFTFIQDYENVSFLEAVKILADKAGINLSLPTQKKVVPNQDYLDMYELANKLYLNNLNTGLGKEAKTYLNNRGITDELIKEFKFGLALNQKDALVKLLQKKGFSLDKIEQYGLANHHQYGSVDIFYNRIMVPLCDTQGRVIAFSGRTYKDTNENKYVNTRQTVLFKKGEILYNYHRAKETARKKNQIIIVEGYMDVIRLYQVGIKNVVATMGTAVTKEQLLLVKKMAQNVILCFDGDEAGEKATWVATNELLKLGVEPYIIRLEDNLDPDEYIKKYTLEKYQQKLDHPLNVMEFKLSYLKKNKDFTSTIDASKYANQVLEEVVKMDDPILKEMTIQRLSEEIGIEKEVLKDQLKALEQHETKEQLTFEIKSTKKLTKYEKAEQYLLYYIFNESKVLKKFIQWTIFLPTAKYRELARACKQYYEEYQDYNQADLISYFRDQPELLETIKEVNSLNLKDEYSEEQINDYFNTVQDYNYKNEIKRLKEELKKTNDLEKKLKLSNQILEINKKSKGENNEKSNK